MDCYGPLEHTQVKRQMLLVILIMSLIRRGSNILSEHITSCLPANRRVYLSASHELRTVAATILCEWLCGALVLLPF